MNLHLPWVNTPHGTAYAGLLMVASTVGVLLYFKAKKWF
jgi:Mg2+ and Co2+ transporter CorA